MTGRASALATLAAIASSPDAVEQSAAHLRAAIDALVTVYATADQAGMTERQAAVRSPVAAWSAIYSHAEHRFKTLKAAAKVAA